jgi:hypothetical protein
VDPTFNTHSTLFRSDSLQRKRQFFNCSQHSPELAASGSPFAFFPRHSIGYGDGFPVFFPVLTHLSLPCDASVAGKFYAGKNVLPGVLMAILSQATNEVSALKQYM